MEWELQVSYSPQLLLMVGTGPDRPPRALFLLPPLSIPYERCKSEERGCWGRQQQYVLWEKELTEPRSGLGTQ